MNLVNLEQASKAYGERPLLDRVSLGVTAGDRIGVVGRNGTGKTTLLGALAGTIDLDSGRSTRTRGITVGTLAQSQQLSGRVRDVVFGALPEHEWAADPRSRSVIGALLSDVDLDGERRPPVGRRAPPDHAGRGAARLRRPAAAGRAHQPPGHRGHQLARGLPARVRQELRGGDPRPVVPGRGLRAHLGTGRRPGARLRGRLLGLRAGQGRAGPAGRGGGPPAAQPAAQGAGLAAARAAGPDEQAEVPHRRRDGTDRRRAAAARRRGADPAGRGPAGQDGHRAGGRHGAAPRERPAHAAGRRHLAARAGRPDRRGGGQRQRQDHPAAGDGGRAAAGPGTGGAPGRRACTPGR